MPLLFSPDTFEIMKARIAEKIRILRLSKNLSQQNIADELNLTVAAYSNIERGVSDINLARLSEIARILDTTPIDLLSDDMVAREPNLQYQNNINQQLLLMMKQLELFQNQLDTLQQEVNRLKNK
ncbi:MAG TPA: helix-turn-helix transcriptional regulator [Fluviicola sp.]|nr:helix-turn-helix transcriptional regulator [Fluviicola sp.]